MIIALALIKIFVMIIPGYVARKFNTFKKSTSIELATVATTVTYPCMILSSMQLDYSSQVVKNALIIVLIFTILILVLLLLAKLLVKIKNINVNQSNLFIFMSVFGNTGMIGVVVLNSLFGQEAAFYGILCDAVYDIFMFSVGMQMVKMGGSNIKDKFRKKTFLRSLMNPCFVSVILGLLLFSAQISLPNVFKESIEIIGSATPAMAMLILGIQLATIPIKDFFSNSIIFWTCFLKLLVTPFLALLIVHQVTWMPDLLKLVIVIQAGMPVALSSVVFAQKFDRDIDFATKGTLLSTLLSIVTIPITAICAQYVLFP
ncbi:AEC family transporter [Paenibacillus sp. J22TS3]|uniref:AEC family transporter n=1 Tax=Paenibacillus sp. J22TS3 TaxID=2807192 RepID=UPI001B227363|nr:AEC family transporter [Paenibacillus sp. J22TS3]GIP22742.1 transporter [Paenibacillus sp. J22TS3]